LQMQPSVISEEIDRMLFERIQNSITWRRLEVMQEIQINDVDKQLSNFLTELKNGYHDVYLELKCIDLNGKIIASSNVSEIGKIIKQRQPMLRVDDQLGLEPLDIDNFHNQANLTINTDVLSQFKSNIIGKLL